MARKIVVGGIGLIAAYLVLKNFTGFTKDTTSATNGAASVIDAFQGR